MTALLRGQFDIAVLTYEMFTRLALANPHLLRIISVIVIDEVQTVVDPGRGPELELLLTLIKSRKDRGSRAAAHRAQSRFWVISAAWTAGWRRTCCAAPNGPSRSKKACSNSPARTALWVRTAWSAPSNSSRPSTATRGRAPCLIPLLRKLVADGQQVIVIRGIRGETRGAARYLADALGLPPAAEALAALPAGDPSIASGDLRRCLAGGVAFHISDLDRDERRVIEDSFRAPDSAIRVVVATTTLAQGVNMPAETVVMPELHRRISQQRVPALPGG